MCSVCTTSYGPDRYGPQYAGRYGFQGQAPGATPWLKNDPACPGCRVGAFAAGEARPPMPNAQQTRAAGQALNDGPIPSSMASYAPDGRPFYAPFTRGTPMPPQFPLGFLPVGAGLDIPRGMMPMSAPASILKPVTHWFGFQLK